MWLAQLKWGGERDKNIYTYRVTIGVYDPFYARTPCKLLSVIAVISSRQRSLSHIAERPFAHVRIGMFLKKIRFCNQYISTETHKRMPGIIDERFHKGRGMDSVLESYNLNYTMGIAWNREMWVMNTAIQIHTIVLYIVQNPEKILNDQPIIVHPLFLNAINVLPTRVCVKIGEMGELF